MRLPVLCAATVVLSAIAASASAGEVSKSTLNSMGFANMSQLSDNDGLAVRGKGTSASVWGAGTANYLGQTSTNGYTASASNHYGSSNAAGGNVSFGGVIHGVANNNGFSVHGMIGIAGGTSFATAH
jgi:hypothetical protein